MQDESLQNGFLIIHTVRMNAVTQKQTVFVQYGLGGILRLLLREIWLMLAVFAVIFGIGLAVALSMGKSYTAGASLLMQLGQDYVYVPLAGDAARGAIATIDEVVQSEVEILNSTELKYRVIDKLGYHVILPDDYAPNWVPRNDADKEAALTAALKELRGGFSSQTAPQNNIVRLTYKHKNPQSAALILNTLIDIYQKYRLEVFSDTTAPLLQQQKDAFDRRLREADKSYEDFLLRNDVGDFQAAKQTYANLYSSLTTELYQIDAQLAQASARLGAVSRRLGQLAPEMSIERNLDLSVPTRLLNLRQQRQELLARYTPESAPVRAVDDQIRELEAMMASGRAIGEKEHRIGVNPAHQQLFTEKLQLESEVAALNGRKAQIQAQAEQVTHKMHSLVGIEAEFNSLNTERAALQTNLSTFTARIQESEASQQIAEGASDTVRVVNRARPPDKPKSLRKPIAILSFLFAGFTALCAGLLRVFLHKGFVDAEMASQTLDLPLLAQARAK